MFVPHDRASRRVQLSIRCSHRIYDRSIARLGSGKAQRYFAFDFDQLSNRSFDASGFEAIEVVAANAQPRSTAYARPVQQCSTGSNEGELHESCQNCFNQLKIKKNALVLSHGSFVGPKIDWTDLNYKSD